MRRPNFSILTSRIPPRRFVLTLVLLAVAAFCVVNAHIPFSLALDPFALWHGDGPRLVLANERMNKYLLAHRYVPRNFDGVLIGPSLSANFDTRKIAARRIYNLSVNGGNATELRHIFTPAAASGRLKYMIISLDPYILASQGFKDSTLNWVRPWEAALLSMPSRWAVVRALHLRPMEDIFEDSPAGWNNFDLRKPRDLSRFNDAALNRPISPDEIGRVPISVMPGAMQDLKAMVALAHAKGIKVFAYYFPYDAIKFEIELSHGWHDFRATVETAFGPGDVVWDMNTSTYDYIRRRGESYTDGHLSQSGTALVLADIQRRLDAQLPQ